MCTPERILSSNRFPTAAILKTRSTTLPRPPSTSTPPWRPRPSADGRCAAVRPFPPLHAKRTFSVHGASRALGVVHRETHKQSQDHKDDELEPQVAAPGPRLREAEGPGGRETRHRRVGPGRDARRRIGGQNPRVAPIACHQRFEDLGTNAACPRRPHTAPFRASGHDARACAVRVRPQPRPSTTYLRRVAQEGARSPRPGLAGLHLGEMIHLHGGKVKARIGIGVAGRRHRSPREQNLPRAPRAPRSTWTLRSPSRLQTGTTTTKESYGRQRIARTAPTSGPTSPRGAPHRAPTCPPCSPSLVRLPRSLPTFGGSARALRPGARPAPRPLRPPAPTVAHTLPSRLLARLHRPPRCSFPACALPGPCLRVLCTAQREPWPSAVFKSSSRRRPPGASARVRRTSRRSSVALE